VDSSHLSPHFFYLSLIYSSSANISTLALAADACVHHNHKTKTQIKQWLLAIKYELRDNELEEHYTTMDCLALILSPGVLYPVFGKILAGPEKFSSGKERKTQLKIAKNPPLRPK
jgi:hypothetical protein